MIYQIQYRADFCGREREREGKKRVMRICTYMYIYEYTCYAHMYIYVYIWIYVSHPQHLRFAGYGAYQISNFVTRYQIYKFMCPISYEAGFWEISPAMHCNTLQHTAAYFNALQLTTNTATYCNTLLHTATYCNTPLKRITWCRSLCLQSAPPREWKHAV